MLEVHTFVRLDFPQRLKLKALLLRVVHLG
jgi:hypothetical protein